MTLKTNRKNIGLGLRKEHYSDFLNPTTHTKSCIDTLEVISENYFRSEGKGFQNLIKIREDFEISCHGVSLSIARLDEIDWQYLEDLKKFHNIISPKIISDHLCFTGLGHSNTHNLLPFVYNEENLKLIGERILKVQDFLKRELVIENLSMYLKYKHSTMEEFEFMQALHNQFGVRFLLDLNNIVVNQINFGIEPLSYIEALPEKSVVELHLAGHTHLGKFAFDTHSENVSLPTLELFGHAIAKFPNALVMLERDDNIPELSSLLEEINNLQLIREKRIR